MNEEVPDELIDSDVAREKVVRSGMELGVESECLFLFDFDSVDDESFIVIGVLLADFDVFLLHLLKNDLISHLSSSCNLDHTSIHMKLLEYYK